MFLMCIDCHDRAPNTPSVEAFLLWTEKQNWYANFKEQVKQEINTYGLQHRIAELAELISSEECRKEIAKSCGIHMNQRGRGSEITISTFIAALYDFLNKRDKMKEFQDDINLGLVP
ncbi:hypothetical protein [Brevibacillus parabrevis]|uniref:hypothetical protein n=1 Tax=Brevibacillus parabrevis TaxID=54914 RepID=UPI0028D7DDFB|nr:hypothetical protein [Brevibacillus parabrevis]